MQQEGWAYDNHADLANVTMPTVRIKETLATEI